VSTSQVKYRWRRISGARATICDAHALGTNYSAYRYLLRRLGIHDARMAALCDGL